jgi:hypothetical protein
LDHFTHSEEVLSPDQLPGLLTLITVDCILARLSMVLIPNSETEEEETVKVEIEKIFPVVLKLVKAYQGFARCEFSLHFIQLKLSCLHVTHINT